MSEEERTVWCGNLSEKVTEDLLYELFLQAGPLESVRIPKCRDGRQRNFGFITFKHVCSVPYSVSLFEGTSLYNKVLHLQTRNCTTVNAPQVGIGLKGYDMNRLRTQSLPLNFGMPATVPAVSDCNLFLQLGQQMCIPGAMSSIPSHLTPYSFLPQNTGSPLYASQMNSSYYLGGDLTPKTKIEMNNRDNHGHSRNHPYSRGSGSRGYEHNHNNNGRHSSSNSPQYHHDKGYRGNGGRRY